MSLNKYFKIEKEDKAKKLEKLTKKLMKEEGLDEKTALHKAEMEIMKPAKLEKIDLKGNTNVGARPSVTFFFDTKEEIELVARLFNLNRRLMHVNDSTLLLELLEKQKAKDEK